MTFVHTVSSRVHRNKTNTGLAKGNASPQRSSCWGSNSYSLISIQWQKHDWLVWNRCTVGFRLWASDHLDCSWHCINKDDWAELVWRELTAVSSETDQTTRRSNRKCETTPAKRKKMNLVAQNDTNEASIGSSKFQARRLKDSWLNQVLEIWECLMMRTLTSDIWVVFKSWMSL